MKSQGEGVGIGGGKTGQGLVGKKSILLYYFPSQLAFLI